MVQKTDLKADRDKQVQVRLPASLHKQLKLALIQDDSSLADFFNEAAEAYLKNPENTDLRTDIIFVRFSYWMKKWILSLQIDWFYSKIIISNE